jgi:hypothetical protein
METAFSPDDLKKAKRALSRYKTGISKPFKLMCEKVEISTHWFNDQECVSIKVEHPPNANTPWGSYKHLRIIRNFKVGEVVKTEYGIKDITPEDVCCAVSMIAICDVHDS